MREGRARPARVSARLPLSRGKRPIARLRYGLKSRNTSKERISARGKTEDRLAFRRLYVETDVRMSMNSLRPGSDAGTRATVLVVEDDPSLRLLCRVNLELEHYRVLEAADLDRATALLMEEPINVVLLDLHVGDRQGVELVPVIRAERPGAGICLLSGTSEADPPTIE